MNPTKALPSYLFKISFNIIFVSTPRSSKWFVSVPAKTLYRTYFLHRACHMPAHVFRHELINVIIGYLVRGTNREDPHSEISPASYEFLSFKDIDYSSKTFLQSLKMLCLMKFQHAVEETDLEGVVLTSESIVTQTIG